MADAGKVLPIYKGAYNKDTTYEILDLVSTKDEKGNGSVWMSKKDDNTGNVPSEGSEYWSLYLSVNSFTLTPATESNLGGVTIGDNINVLNGKISVSTATDNTGGVMTNAQAIKLAGIAEGANNYSLPKATADSLGGVTVGSGININEGKISVPTATDSKGGLMTDAQAQKLSGGIITSVKMNGSTVSTGGEADLGTVLTSHQSLAGYATQTWVDQQGYTKNVGTITGVTVDGYTKTSGVVDVGKYITNGSTLGGMDLVTYSNNDSPNRETTAWCDGYYDFAILYIYPDSLGSGDGAGIQMFTASSCFLERARDDVRINSSCITFGNESGNPFRFFKDAYGKVIIKAPNGKAGTTTHFKVNFIRLAR